LEGEGFEEQQEMGCVEGAGGDGGVGREVETKIGEEGVEEVGKGFDFDFETT